LIAPPPPCRSPFPYTTLFRSLVLVGARWAWSRMRRRRVRAKGPGDQALDLAAWAGAGALVGVGSAVLGEYRRAHRMTGKVALIRSEEHTSELQSRFDLVCRLL